MNVKKSSSLFKFLMISIGICTFLSCKQNEYKENLEITAAAMNTTYETADATSDLKNNKSTTAAPQNLKIITSASVKYKVESVKLATKKIKKYAQQYQAYISDQKFENTLYHLENKLTIKIPQQHFDSMMDAIVLVAEFVDYENITTEDVTEHYLDIQTRLTTKLVVKERYEAVLRKNAKTVDDILATEEKLRVIQEEIEAAQGKLKYLTHKVGFSTIQIDLYETVAYKEEPEVYQKTFWTKSIEGILFGWDFIASTFLAVLHIWPIVLVAMCVIYFIKRRRKK